MQTGKNNVELRFLSLSLAFGEPAPSSEGAKRKSDGRPYGTYRNDLRVFVGLPRLWIPPSRFACHLPLGKGGDEPRNDSLS